KRLGVVGSMVWDTIYGRDPAQPAVEEWGGISYSLAALDATLPDDWVIVPIVKVGRDLAMRANAFLRTLRHVAPGSRFIEVPEANGTRVLQPLADAPTWFGCFDVAQLNEAEMQQLGHDPLGAAAAALAQGCQTLLVTLGARGAAYFEQDTDTQTRRRTGPVRTA